MNYSGYISFFNGYIKDLIISGLCEGEVKKEILLAINNYSKTAYSIDDIIEIFDYSERHKYDKCRFLAVNCTKLVLGIKIK